MEFHRLTQADMNSDRQPLPATSAHFSVSDTPALIGPGNFLRSASRGVRA